MKKYFYSCPDCGDETYPNLVRGDTYYEQDTVYATSVRAECPVCGWTTGYHDSVKKCERAWNDKEMRKAMK